MFRVCHVFLSGPCSLVVTCWERADLFAIMCDDLLRFFTFQCGVLGPVWCLIVPISDLCLLSYFCKYKYVRII